MSHQKLASVASKKEIVSCGINEGSFCEMADCFVLPMISGNVMSQLALALGHVYTVHRVKTEGHGRLTVPLLERAARCCHSQGRL